MYIRCMSGELVPQTTDEKQLALRTRDNVVALARIMANKRWDPFNQLVPLDFAVEIEPYLKGCENLNELTRSRAYRAYEIYLSSAGQSISKQELVRRMQVSYAFINQLQAQWPSYWTFLNVLMRAELEERAHEVDRAMLHAAINGGVKDRELYYKLVGRLQAESSRGGGTIVFVNDQITRPGGSERIVTGVIVENVEPAEQDSVD